MLRERSRWARLAAGTSRPTSRSLSTLRKTSAGAVEDNTPCVHDNDPLEGASYMEWVTCTTPMFSRRLRSLR